MTRPAELWAHARADALNLAHQWPLDAPRDCQMESAMAPSLPELRGRFATTPARKAHGKDALPPEVYRNIPGTLSRAMWPIFLKATLGLTEPILWKGGL